MLHDRDFTVRAPRRRARYVYLALALLCLLAPGVTADDGLPLEIAHFDLTVTAADSAPPKSPLVRRVGLPKQTDKGVVFNGRKIQGLLYGDGVRGELRLKPDLSIWVRAAFADGDSRPLADHDTLVSRWGPAGSYSLLLRSDHHRGTLYLFLSPDGHQICGFDSRYRVPRDGAFHDYLVVVRASRDVRFFVDGVLQSVIREPRPPAGLRGTDAKVAPFAIGYNSDPAPGGDHESMHGTIADVRVFAGALTAAQAAKLSGLERPSAEEDTAIRVRIDSNAAGPTISPRLFGHFLEHFPRQVYGAVFEPGSPHADVAGFRTDVLHAMREAGTSIVRWPGGNYTSGYDWRWGAGRTDERISRAAPHWGFEEDHTFGTTEFVEMTRRVGAKPLICVGVGRDSRCPTPKDAAAWVRYCNARQGPEARLRAEAGCSEPLDVITWGLGNEVWGPWQIGHYRKPEDYERDVIHYTKAMRAADDRLRFVLVGNDRAWNEKILTREVTRLCDWVSWHDYFHMGYRGQRRRHEEACEHLVWVEATLADLGELAHKRSRTAGRKSPMMLAVDEWNEFAWDEQRPAANDDPRPYDVAHALYTAGYLNVFLRQAGFVDMGCYAPGVNGRGMMMADDRGVLLRSTYHVFALYKDSSGGHLLPSTTTAPRLSDSTASALDVAAVRAVDGSVLVFLLNREASEAVRVAVRTSDGTETARADAVVLTGPSLSAHNDFDAPDRVSARPFAVTGGAHVTLEIPAHSLVRLRLRK